MLGGEEETRGQEKIWQRLITAEVNVSQPAGCYRMLERWTHKGGKGPKGGRQVEREREAEARVYAVVL